MRNLWKLSGKPMMKKKQTINLCSCSKMSQEKTWRRGILVSRGFLRFIFSCFIATPFIRFMFCVYVLQLRCFMALCFMHYVLQLPRFICFICFIATQFYSLTFFVLQILSLYLCVLYCIDTQFYNCVVLYLPSFIALLTLIITLTQFQSFTFYRY